MITRVVVRDKATGLYLRALGNWTKCEAEACSFSSTATALLFCLRHELATSQIILKFGDEQYDLQFSVREQQSALDGPRMIATRK